MKISARELLEETGYRARSLERLTTIFTTPGFTDEQIHLYAAIWLARVPSAPEADEFLEIHDVAWSAVGRMMRAGDIRDPKTLCALLWLQSFGRDTPPHRGGAAPGLLP